jgi:glyceraldehyde 3-phosphate dehydrogenase
MIKIGINGFGRIGRLALRVILQKHRDELEPVMVNTSGKIDVAGWAHLFNYDTVYGKYHGEVSSTPQEMIIDGVKILTTGEKDPAKIPWGSREAQVVIESTGVFRDFDKVSLHLRDTVGKVIVSAPADDKIPMYIIGVNENNIGQEKIISCASCTTNCLGPIIKVMDQKIGISKALMTTIHAYTSDQELLDGSHKDLRRARAAAVNIVPTTTGAAEAVTKVYPPLKDKFTGLAIRVPVACGSLVDLVFLAKKTVTCQEINQALVEASQTAMKGILGVTDQPLVSSDIIGSDLSTIVDTSLTMVVDQNLVKVVAWYDNELGYASRLAEEVVLLGKSLV